MRGVRVRRGDGLRRRVASGAGAGAAAVAAGAVEACSGAGGSGGGAVTARSDGGASGGGGSGLGRTTGFGFGFGRGAGAIGSGLGGATTGAGTGADTSTPTTAGGVASTGLRAHVVVSHHSVAACAAQTSTNGMPRASPVQRKGARALTRGRPPAQRQARLYGRRRVEGARSSGSLFVARIGIDG